MKTFSSVLILLIVSSLPSFCRGKLQGYCEKGGVSVTTGGTAGTPKVQASYPSCTVTIYDAGTMNLSSIFEDNAGTVKANPFTAASTGLWFFYADNGRYDVRMSGTVNPAFTLGDMLVTDPTQGAVSFPISLAQGGTGATSKATAKDSSHLNIPFLVTSDFDFAAQSPAASLTAGMDATVTLAPCPLGVNWNDSSHELWITDAVVGNEAVSIKPTGPGTCTSGAASGTVTLTGIGLNHAQGDWSIGSMTEGIREAIIAAPPGGEVRIPEGTHAVGKIVVDKLVKLIGTGRSSTILVPITVSAEELLAISPATPMSNLQVSGIAIYASANAVPCMTVNNAYSTLVSNMLFVGGTYGLRVTNSGSSHFTDLIFRNQTTASYSEDGDNSAENYYQNFDIARDEAGTTATAFEIPREEGLDVGGHYLSHIRITRSAGTITTGFKFTAVLANTFFGIQALDCVADNINGGNAVLFRNALNARFANSWLINNHTDAAVLIDGGGQMSFVNNWLNSTAGYGVEFKNAPAGLRFISNQMVSNQSFGMPAANPPTDLYISGNYILTAVSNDIGALANAADAAKDKNVSSPHVVLTHPSAGIPQTFGLVDAVGGTGKYFRVSGGTLQILNNAGDATVFSVTDGGVSTIPVAIIGTSVVQSGAGSPEGAVTGKPGDMWLRTDGGAGTTLYIKETGAGTNTGWVGK